MFESEVKCRMGIKQKEEFNSLVEDIKKNKKFNKLNKESLVMLFKYFIVF